MTSRLARRVPCIVVGNGSSSENSTNRRDRGGHIDGLEWFVVDCLDFSASCPGGFAAMGHGCGARRGARDDWCGVGAFYFAVVGVRHDNRHSIGERIVCPRYGLRGASSLAGVDCDFDGCAHHWLFVATARAGCIWDVARIGFIRVDSLGALIFHELRLHAVRVLFARRNRGSL